MTRACIHFGSHNHHVPINGCCESIMITKTLMRLKVEKNPIATTLTIVLAINKTLLNHGLFGSSEPTTTKLQQAHLRGLIDRFLTFFSPNIKNLVSTFKHGNVRHGPLDNILELKRDILYDYIQDNVFPSQGLSEIYIFKMSTKGKGNGVDLVTLCN